MSKLAALRDPVVANSVAIMSSTLVTSGLGFVFWIVVARLANAEVSGIGAAFASGVQLVAVVASIGAAAALVEWLPRAQSDHQWRQFVTVGMVTALVTSLIGAAFIVISTLSGLALVPGLDRVGPSVAFMASAVLFAIGSVVDYICISEARGRVLLLRNSLMCGLRIPFFALLLLQATGTDAIFWAWTISALLSIIYAWWSFARREGRTLAPAFGQVRGHLWQMRHSLAGQHLITVAAMIPGYLLPLIVVARLDAAQNAYFYITWMLGSVFFMVSPAVSTSLFAAAATHGVSERLVLRGLGLILALLALPILAYLLGGRLLLSMFGAEYAEAGALLLVLLTISSIPDALTNVVVAVLRASNRLAAAIWLNFAIAIIVVVMSWVTLPTWGIEAVGIWWLAAQTLGALVTIVFWRKIVPKRAAVASESA